MPYWDRGKHAFTGDELSIYLGRKLDTMADDIRTQTPEYLLQINEQDYVVHLADQYAIDVLVLAFDEVYATGSEAMIPADEFPGGFNVHRGGSYSKPVLTFHIPFTGDIELINMRSSSSLSWTAIVHIDRSDVCFDIVDFHGDPMAINREVESQLTNLRTLYGFMKQEVDQFNTGLPGRAAQLVQQRRQELQERQEKYTALSVPVRRAGHVASTFAIPIPPPRRVQIAKPSTKQAPFEREPVVSQDAYQFILQVMHDVGQSMERKPSTFAGKSEEDLRDHLLTFLESHHESVGSATGETFNKTGKTDILLRFENKNVFVAECKFWGGQKQFLETIDQLLRYLTWRDSKASIVIFSKNKGFSEVLSSIPIAAESHQNFLVAQGVKDETRFDFLFHLPGDRGRKVQLAVLVFDFS